MGGRSEQGCAEFVSLPVQITLGWRGVIFLSSLIYFETVQVGKGQRGRQRASSVLCIVTAEPDVGLELMNYEIMT